jgi:amidohydrolase
LAALHTTLAALVPALALTLSGSAAAQTLGDQLREAIAVQAKVLEPKLIGWRRDIHAHPELGNQETRTAELVAAHLRALGLQVRTGVARTGVVAVLEGGKPGPVVALRADMDALPVKEVTGLPFASQARGRYRGQEVDVMHACGHDGHTAILMTVAELLTGLKAQLPGKVVFYFQPAEEGPSEVVKDGKVTWGAKMMIAEGAMKSPRPAAVFGLHLWAKLPAGEIAFRPGATMASSDDLNITVFGKQTHAASPWDGIDPIVISAQAISALQTVVSREHDIGESPAVVSIGTIHGGIRYNIIPERVDMEGTIRAYDQRARKTVHESVRRKIEHVAIAGGGRAEVTIREKYDPTVNDPALTERSAPSLSWAANGAVSTAKRVSGAEDFSFMAKEVPGLFFFLGVAQRGVDMSKVAPNHSPYFTIDESALIVGVRALAALATDFLSSAGAALPAPPAARAR